MTPKWVQNCTQIGRKWAPKGSKIAPWSPPGARWRPWGALGGPRQIFEGFLVPCWGPFGLPKSSKNWSKIKLKSSIAWDPHFGGSGSPRDQFLEPFWGSFWVLFCPPTAGSRNLWKTWIFDDSTALFAVFSGPRGPKIEEKWVRKQHPAGTGLQERLGRLQGAILEPFGGHLGPPDRSGRGSDNELAFCEFAGRLLEWEG